MPTISQRAAEKQTSYWQEKGSQGIPQAVKEGLGAGAAFHGQRLLARGKFIQFYSDNNVGPGPGNIPVLVAGRHYFLKSGLAELSLLTGAPIIPYQVNILPGGHIHITFHPPFILEPGEREAQVESLMKQYAEFLTNCWVSAPESFSWVRIKNHLKRPLGRQP